MRLGILFVVIAFVIIFSICESKSTKKAPKKSKDDTKAVKSSHPSLKSKVKSDSKSTKKVEAKKEKVPAKSAKKEKVAKKAKEAAKAKSKSKIADKKKANKPSQDKPKKKPADKKVEVSKKPESKAKETLKAPVPNNCDDIVRQYVNGELIMYEYKIKMKRCLNGQKEDALRTALSSKYEDDSNAAFFKHAMKYVNDEGSANYYDDDDEDDAEKKSNVPANSAELMNTPITADINTANYYPMQDRALFEQQRNSDQSQAAFNQDPMANQAAPVQQNYNYYTRSNVPAAPQPSQDMNQWNAPSAYAATKKDTLPAAPAAQPDDPFANFMNMQSSQNAAPQAPQQRSNIPAPVAAPQEIQQRNDIPAPVPAPQETQQRSAIPIDAAYQAPVDQAYPSMQQAYFRDHLRKWSPEDDGMFPENP